MVLQDIPGGDVRLPAGEPRHDRIHVSVHDPDLPVSCRGPPVEAVRRGGLHHDHDGGILPIAVCEVAHHRAGQTSDTGLHEDMGRTLAVLIPRLVRHGAVALHDPGRDLLIALPGGILHHDAVLGLLRELRGLPHALIIVHLGDPGLRVLRLDVIQPRHRGALRHDDDGLLMELIRCPGDAPSVVSVGRGVEGRRAEPFPELLRGEHAVGKLRDILPGLLPDIAGDGVGAAEHLKGI